jgi:hypothetical protein
MSARSLFKNQSSRAVSEEAVLCRPSDDDALQLVVAFYCIMEPEKRNEILGLAERYAKESQTVQGFTHYLLLDELKSPESQ